MIEQGFTLVELLIVIVILGILAGIVVFAVGNLTGTATNNSVRDGSFDLHHGVERVQGVRTRTSFLVRVAP